MSTNLSPEAQANLDAARRANGQFGHQVKTEAEGSLSSKSFAVAPPTPLTAVASHANPYYRYRPDADDLCVGQFVIEETPDDAIIREVTRVDAIDDGVRIYLDHQKTGYEFSHWDRSPWPRASEHDLLFREDGIGFVPERGFTQREPLDPRDLRTGDVVVYQNEPIMVASTQRLDGGKAVSISFTPADGGYIAEATLVFDDPETADELQTASAVDVSTFCATAPDGHAPGVDLPRYATYQHFLHATDEAYEVLGSLPDHPQSYGDGGVSLNLHATTGRRVVFLRHLRTGEVSTTPDIADRGWSAT